MERSNSFEGIIEDHLDQIESWVENNNTDKEIAGKLGIAYSTFRKYKVANAALKGRIAMAKDKKSQEVEKALFKKCIGYKYKEKVATKIKTETLAEDGKTILVIESVDISEIEKYSGPDLAAQKLYLTNRSGTKWKENPHRVENDKKLTNLKEREINSKVIEL